MGELRPKQSENREPRCPDSKPLLESLTTVPTLNPSLPPIVSFLRSAQRYCAGTASTFDVVNNDVFQNLMKDNMTTAFLAATGSGSRMAANSWTTGIILNRRAEARRLLEMATDQLRAVLQRFQSGVARKKLDFLMRPALEGVDAKSYTPSYVGWKRDALDGLQQLQTNKEITTADRKKLQGLKGELEDLVTQIDEHALTYWKLRSD